MEQHPTLPDGWQQIQRTALDMVACERQRQIAEKGYGYGHDDRHTCEEIACAAAFFLLPQFLDQDVCAHCLEVQSLLELLGNGAWDGIHRDDYNDPGIRSDVQVDTRINQLVKGLALGLAELERWMRARELRSCVEAPASGLTPIEEVLDQAAMFAMENSHKAGWANFNYPAEWLKRRAELVAQLEAR